MFSQYGELPPTSGWDRFGSLGHPCKFQRVSHLGSVTTWHSSSGRQPNFTALNRGRHLYLAGWPSRWALAHICSWFLQIYTDFAIWQCKLHRATYSRFDTIPACDRQTDRQMDGIAIASTAPAIRALRRAVIKLKKWSFLCHIHLLYKISLILNALMRSNFSVLMFPVIWAGTIMWLTYL